VIGIYIIIGIFNIVYYNIETLTGQYNIIIINIDLRGSASETRYIIIMTCGTGILKNNIYICNIRRFGGGGG